MKRKLFCEICGFTYCISVFKCCLMRKLHNLVSMKRFAKEISKDHLPVLIYAHNSLIRRKLGNVNQKLQENKAVNLGLAAPLVSGIIIKPDETFSFWELVGRCTRRKGYKDGLTIMGSTVSSGVGGGMCQFTNLIHWLILHTPLDITEHHHHDGLDLFPDYGRQIPFGTGTSIMYNYLDYQFKNNGDQPFQLIIYTTDEYLCGEIRALHPLEVSYHIKSRDEQFIRSGDNVYRTGKVLRECIDKKTGNLISCNVIKENYARVMYEIDETMIKKETNV